MSAWIKVQTGLSRTPEVIRISSILGVPRPHVIGMLVEVWGWFDFATEDGNAIGVTKAFMDELAGVTGFGEAMEAVGWLSERDGVIIIPRFEKHNGSSAKKRANTTSRQSAFKARSNAASVTGALPKALPEKRREEKKREEFTPNVIHTRTSASANEKTNIDSQRLERIVRSYCKAANKVVSAEAVKGALRIIQSGEATLDELTLKVAAIVEQLDRSPRSELRFAKHPDVVFCQDGWKSEPEAFRLGADPNGDTVGSERPLPTLNI